MIDRAIHPGACSVSEAILCAQDPEPVIAWAFSNQEQIMTASTNNPLAAANMAKAQFPALAACIGSPEVQAKLNLSLRWAVKNQLQILTPQVFVEGARLCGEDTDLGLDYALTRLIERMKNRPLAEATPGEKQDQVGEEPAPQGSTKSLQSTLGTRRQKGATSESDLKANQRGEPEPADEEVSEGNSPSANAEREAASDPTPVVPQTPPDARTSAAPVKEPEEKNLQMNEEVAQ
jgi:hypothetical protein